MYENNVKYPIYVSKKCFEEKHVDLLLVGEKKMFLSKILIHLCMIIRYTVEEKIFVVIVSKILAQKILKCHVKDCFKINGKQMIKMAKKGE